MGDFNAKVGSDRDWREKEIGPDGKGSMHENGELFTDISSVNNLVIGGTRFAHQKCHHVTWVSPDTARFV